MGGEGCRRWLSGGVVGDQLDRTATQVRDRKTVHDLDQADSGRTGRFYETACGEVLHAAAGAVLTTDRANCEACRG